MRLLKELYEKRMGKPAPYYYDYSLLTIISKPVRKFASQVIAPNCPFNNLRVKIYRLCGFKIGTGCSKKWMMMAIMSLLSELPWMVKSSDLFNSNP